MVKLILIFLLLLLLNCSSKQTDYDVVVYGGTPSGVIAAVAAARNGASVILIEQTMHVGGLNTSGLITAEVNHMINKSITGIAREFYTRMGEYYSPEFFESFGQGRKLNFEPGDPAFFFESHVAEKVFNQMLEEAAVEVIYETYVQEAIKKENQIASISLTNGIELSGKVFIDATYEGDLMARSGVSYTFGRESQEKYEESYAGIRFVDDTLYGRTVAENGKLLPYFTQNEGLIPGAADQRVMNYNFRPTMTKNPDNFVMVTKPENYNPKQFSLLSDYLSKNPDTRIWDLIGVYPRGNDKYEFNNKQHSTISLGLFGGNVDYPDADYEKREEIYQAHKDYTLGYLYFLGHDESVPEQLKKDMLSYGFCKDEFADNDHFPYYLYIREARRMIGDQVFTQHDVLENRNKEDAVALGSHWIDSHHVQRVAISDTSFTNEGRIWHTVTKPFELPYSIILPKTEESANLLVPVAASTSHVAFCAYRLEPTWMQMGHVAGTAAAMSIKSGKTLHGIAIADLQQQLKNEKMILQLEDLSPYDDYE
jgi:hypothetical protein